MTTGRVKWFNADRGYGFISPDDGGADVFFDYTAIPEERDFSLNEDQEVEFDIDPAQKGPYAKSLRPPRIVKGL